MEREVVMKKFIPRQKLSKKKRRTMDSAKRAVWSINPVTRKPANPKAYKRKKVSKGDDLFLEPFYFIKSSACAGIEHGKKVCYH